MINAFIDGKEGTTGLQIFDRLEKRDDVNVIKIDEKDRKNEKIRAKLIDESDVTFLCLPDQAAIDAVKLVKNKKVAIIDASTAHRTNKDWAYGFAELDSVYRQKIETSNRIANPGCHASGFNAIVYPLVKCGILPKDYPIVCHSITGFSGGGKKMIAEYKNAGRDTNFDSPRQYALQQTHKHHKEMKYISMLDETPIFNPIVADFEKGMEVSVPLYSKLLKGVGAKEIQQTLAEHYKAQKMVKVMNFDNDIKLLPANKLADKNHMEIYVFGDNDRILISAVFDNLGKGASGSAVQNMNIRFGIEETYGLI